MIKKKSETISGKHSADSL